jgi:predicted transcriptional regulator
MKQPLVAEVIAETPVAMTLKLPHDVYIQLKLVAAKRKTKSQVIMLEAVRAYLDSLDKA